MFTISIKITFIVLITCMCQAFGQHTVTVQKKGVTYTLQGDTTKYKFKSKIAEYEERYADAAHYLLNAIDQGEYASGKIQDAYYDAACFLTLVQEDEQAIEYLSLSIKNGWEDIGQLTYDPDLQPLKGTSSWKRRIAPFMEAYFKENNKQVAKLYAEDQHARLSGNYDIHLIKEDSIRRTKVLALIKKNQLQSGYDYYKAAMIMHHGAAVADYVWAERLIQDALRLPPVHPMAPWLSAAIKDRLLLQQGKPQWYGTQSMTVINGKIAMDPKLIDTTKVSPQQRKALNTPSIETLREYLANFTSNRP